MKIVGLITEYNPFHNGHLYHLNKSKEITDCDYSIAVMSGGFLQRGEPALVDKWTRAKMAIENGVDLVIELPTIFACQSAEYFAYGAISILDSLGAVDYVCFGSESGNIDKLNLLADILHREPKEFKVKLKQCLNKGLPFPMARSIAIVDYLETLNEKHTISNDEAKKIMSNPNNILALEYLKSLKRLKSSIIPKTIQRVGAHYNSKKIQGEISSATAIRKELFSKGNLDSVKETIPPATYELLKDANKIYHSFNRIENFNDILVYLLRTINRETLKKIPDVDEGLENRIIECAQKFDNINDIINCINTKRYTYTRIQRIMMHVLLGFNQETIRNLLKTGPCYIRVLAFNSRGTEILNKFKKTCRLPIITKFANYRRIKDENLKLMINYDKTATDVYFLGVKEYKMDKCNLDFLNSPYIKTDNKPLTND